MLYRYLFAAFAADASSHGVITWVRGANGVDMAGLTVIEGTPRDCAGNNCGSQADTGIIRKADISVGGSPLGYTAGSGSVDAAASIKRLFGSGGSQLPTADSNGFLELVIHQVDMDGAGPYLADVDGTSGGSDPTAFTPVEVTQNVPGVAGVSTSIMTDFNVIVRIPPGTTCTATVAGF